MDPATQVTSAPSGTQWTIEAGGLRAVVVEVGGGLREIQVDGHHILDGYALDELCPASAGRVLAPWPNRIRDGRYTFGGQEHQLPLTEPAKHNAIHGLVSWQRWTCVAAGPDSVTVEHDLVPQQGYPWPMLLRTQWTVDADGLRAEHTATNTGDRPCPFGLGVHPYFVVPGAGVDDLALRIPGRSRLLLDGRSLPIGAAKVAGTEYDFTEGRRIGAALLDMAFGELDHDADGSTAVILSTVDGRGLRVWADGAFRWWQVFTGDTLPAARRRRSVAVEPMTCPPDAFRSGRDVVTIEPGETWRGAWGIRAVG
jgi:aldose 1-epimerase